MKSKKETSFAEKFNSPISSLWNNHKAFLIIFGIAIAAYKFREVIIDLLVADSRKKINEAKKQDTLLKTEEKQANDQANQLINEAEALSHEKTNVDENWNLK